MTVALVTGAGQGIGRGITLRLARDGHDIALVDVASDKIDAVAQEVRDIGRRATTFVADVTDRDQVFAAVDHVWVTIDKRFAELTGAKEGETYDKFVGGIALGRAQTPDDVAAFVSYLAGPDSDYMTGQAPLIDGGLVYR
ncbi:SDR family oxidoreductase [Rhodococcus sp. BP-252]|uniref:SDR family oxidoreductase n=1 Tax=unclassified Rhodococcus (in: high G+C Gram-positive bacteria) TaxID=192944 RepID=UPI001C9AAF36|nr:MULTISPECIES: SDR family oxidoreductase [unclassified Rhodococcus (in: high G+C Gram-positive bacteria)]MBY6413289.1 SDR family oxidoreductase [Rhodococcus sp. BP-320]MBY6419287.1 SDR family oxidoreductase [Rhodococcus sp. BP-321]MBY6424292.1 SDR family oxidoreductase [Rhodococcus sp. BP-324]MBY6428032.1 SDR family oxidoreductase [Rhodococcus sp. BP-323]MBY6433210.1 SDR family oxidoreductase [Rhodococcus sp. BP-322]